MKACVCLHYLTQNEIDQYFEVAKNGELLENDAFDELLEPHPDLDIEDADDLMVWLSGKFEARYFSYINLGPMDNLLGDDIEHVKTNTLPSLSWMAECLNRTNLYNKADYERLSDGSLTKLGELLDNVSESISRVKDTTDLYVVCLMYTRD